MKLTEFDNDKAFAVIAEVIDIISELMEDEKVFGITSTKKEKWESEPWYGIRVSTKLAGIIAKYHKNKAYILISVLNEIPLAKVSKYNAIKTIKMLMDIFNDKEILTLFTSVQTDIATD